MTTHVNTAVIGAGQAGLAVSYHLTQQARDHLVLEQSDGPADAWRNHRWDSFTLNTPNWQTRLPGADDQGCDPDGFKSRDEIVAYLEQYAALPTAGPLSDPGRKDRAPWQMGKLSRHEP